MGFFVDFAEGSFYGAFVGVYCSPGESPGAAGIGPFGSMLHKDEGSTVCGGGAEEKSCCTEYAPAVFVLGPNTHSIAIMIHGAHFTGEEVCGHFFRGVTVGSVA